MLPVCCSTILFDSYVLATMELEIAMREAVARSLQSFEEEKAERALLAEQAKEELAQKRMQFVSDATLARSLYEEWRAMDARAEESWKRWRAMVNGKAESVLLAQRLYDEENRAAKSWEMWRAKVNFRAMRAQVLKEASQELKDKEDLYESFKDLNLSSAYLGVVACHDGC